MTKPKSISRSQESTEALDWSYVELQENDFLESQGQEFTFVTKEEE
jgi:hypothetical protein